MRKRTELKPLNYKIVGDKAVILADNSEGGTVETIISACHIPKLLALGSVNVRIRKVTDYPYIGLTFAVTAAGRTFNVHDFLHRFVTQAPEGLVVDHVNGRVWDNTDENLRVCTHAENMRNITRPSRSATGVRNVYRNRAGNYFVQIGSERGKRYHGTFDTLFEASQVAEARRAERMAYA